jgi:hypothetical protein
MIVLRGVQNGELFVEFQVAWPPSRAVSGRDGADLISPSIPQLRPARSAKLVPDSAITTLVVSFLCILISVLSLVSLLLFPLLSLNCPHYAVECAVA